MENLFSDKHIMKQFDDELNEIRKLMMEMGGKVELQVKKAVESIFSADSSIAQEVMRNEEDIDALEHDIDEACILILVKRQPAARDLRLVFSITRGVHDLERIGDEANKIAMHAIEMAEDGGLEFGYNEIKVLAETAFSMLHKALDCFARFDEMSARAVLNNSKQEAQYQEILQQVLTLMMEHPQKIKLGVNILWVVRSLQRICDHALNLCEQTIFVIRGEDVR